MTLGPNVEEEVPYRMNQTTSCPETQTIGAAISQQRECNTSVPHEEKQETRCSQSPESAKGLFTL